MTDLLPGLRRMQAVLPEHGCLLVSPGNYWQNQRELFDSDPDLLKTVHQHEPKGLHTSATLRGERAPSPLSVLSVAIVNVPISVCHLKFDTGHL